MSGNKLKSKNYILEIEVICSFIWINFIYNKTIIYYKSGKT